MSNAPTFAPPVPVAAPSLAPQEFPPPVVGRPPVSQSPAPEVRTSASARRRRVVSIAAAVTIVAISVVGLGIQQGHTRTATAGDIGQSAPGSLDDVVPSADAVPQQTASSAPPAVAPVDSVPATTEAPAVVLPTTTAPTSTAPQPAPHSLGGVAAGNCLLDGTAVPCGRGTELVTFVAPSSDQCSAGETTLTVTESASVPQVVIVCLVPWSLDDRSLTQAFTLDATCTQQAVEDTLTFELDGVVCTDGAGVEYVLVKIAEGQMSSYLNDVLAATFLGDFTVDDGQVCGGLYQIDGWDVWVYGYGPFAEFRPTGDTGSVRFDPSLCAA